jgi:hypothetical protein
MIPHLAKNDAVLFDRYLDKARVYFEYGSGGSTYLASTKNNIEKIYSVESDIEWQRKLQANIKSNKVTYFFNEMGTQPNTWGHPGKHRTPAQHIAYSNYLGNLPKAEQQQIDTVMIDGRFCVACCLKCFDIIGKDCLVIFDDFLDRPHYHVVLDYYDVIDQTADNRMVVLRKKAGVDAVPDVLMRKYELICA